MDRNIPGPGEYIPEKPLGSDTFKFSFSGRNGGLKISDFKTNKNPGPGRYNSIEIKGTGKYPISTLRNTTNSIDWNSYKENRFADAGKKIQEKI